MSSVRYEECTEIELKKYKGKYKFKCIKLSSGYYKCIIDNEVVGLIDVSPYNQKSKIYSILDFEVFEKNRGYGSIIIENLLEEFKKEGIYKFEITPVDEEAIRFWGKFGFKHYSGYEYRNF